MMLSDDTYRARLQPIIAELETWGDTIRDVAEVAIGDDGHSWRMAVTPRAKRACAFELVLRADQRFDLAVAGEVYEDRPLEQLDVLLPLVMGIAAGRVVTRAEHSACSGRLVAVETRIPLADGTVWYDRRDLAPSGGGAPARIEARDHHWLPYRR